jgi:hypothetical protein
MVTVIQRLYGLGGAIDLVVDLVVASVAVGEDGELMDTPGNKS